MVWNNHIKLHILAYGYLYISCNIWKKILQAWESCQWPFLDYNKGLTEHSRKWVCGGWWICMWPPLWTLWPSPTNSLVLWLERRIRRIYGSGWCLIRWWWQVESQTMIAEFNLSEKKIFLGQKIHFYLYYICYLYYNRFR